MSNQSKDYKVTEKWWLALVIILYSLYNIPGLPEYGDRIGALWHAAFTIIPLWVVIYVGLIKLNRQRKLDYSAIAREFDEEGEETDNAN